MTALTKADIPLIVDAVKVAFEPKFEGIDRQFLDVKQEFRNVNHRLDKVELSVEVLTHEVHDFKHVCNKRFTAIELRLDSIEYTNRAH